MLPFLKNKKEGSVSAPVETVTREHDEDNYDILDAVAQDMLNALEKKDVRMLKSALESLCSYFMEIDETQDEEQEHDEHSST